MKRLIIDGPCSATFEEVEPPVCPADGIVVKARVTAMSPGTELRVYRAESVDEEGKFLHEFIPFSLPAENGYCLVGTVVESAKGVSDLLGNALSKGDRVLVPAPHKEYAAVSGQQALRLPETLSDEAASLLNILEVGHIALRRGMPEPGCNLCILGQGIIGLSVLAYARAFGLRTAVLDRYEERLATARSLGCHLAVSSESPQFSEEIKAFFHGSGADLVVEAASSQAAVQTGLELVREQGTLVVVSRHLRKPEFNLLGRPYFGKNFHLKTSYGHPSPGSRWDRAHSYRLSLQLLEEGKLNVEPMISARARWEEIPAYYDRMHQGEPGLIGVVFHWDP